LICLRGGGEEGDAAVGEQRGSTLGCFVCGAAGKRGTDLTAECDVSTAVVGVQSGQAGLELWWCGGGGGQGLGAL